MLFKHKRLKYFKLYKTLTTSIATIMKHRVILSAAALGAALFASEGILAQETVVVSEQTVAITDMQCKPRYYNSWRDGWFIQLGAGVELPVMEGFSSQKKTVAATYNFNVGRWFTPYLALRFSAFYDAPHEHLTDNHTFSWYSANVNADLMWDMTNSIGGVDLDRPVSVIGFLGVGGTYNWHFRPGEYVNAKDRDGNLKTNTWSVPVSAGVQLRFRLCKYVDLFLEGRAMFPGDNYNNLVNGRPIDLDFRATGGFTFNIGGRSFKEYDPCAYDAYIATLNGQVNDLRGELAATAAALATAEAQLPCPEATQTVQNVVVNAPLMSTVRFSINSAKVTPMEMVNVYNVAEYMKANPDAKIVITGYADKDTGTSSYNQKLSERRAQAVYDILVNNYGISADRLTKAASGSSVQPYDTNNWNRIVIFSTPE